MTRTADRVDVREVDWWHPDAAALRAAMSAEIDPRYADRRLTMPPPPEMTVDPADVVYVGLAFVDDRAVGHVAVRRLAAELEIKRMFVAADVRGRGVGRTLLVAAEAAAGRLGATRVVLQTGDRQPEAVATYTRSGYTPVPIFPPYLSLPFSRCFAKDLARTRTTTR